LPEYDIYTGEVIRLEKNLSEIYKIKTKTRAKIKTKINKPDGAPKFKRGPKPFAPGAFSSSLESMTANDIELNEAAKNAKKPSFDFARYFILAVSLGVFAFSAYNIALRLYSYVESAREYDRIESIFYFQGDDGRADFQILRQPRASDPIQDIFALQVYGAPIVETEIITEIRNIEQRRSNVNSLIDINPDYFAWISVKGTNIEYPVVQGRDNEVYLKRSFEGRRSDGGAIYIDFENSRDLLENRNTIIYGHNMMDSSMFQPLLRFGTDRAMFDRGVIELTTVDMITYRYLVFSAREEHISFYYIKIDFKNDEEWLGFLTEAQERSNFHKDIELYAEDRILTLSTCINNNVTKDMRFTVQAVLFEIIEP
jgi:sortase B